MLTIAVVMLAQTLGPSSGHEVKGTPWKKPAVIYGACAVGDLLSTEISLRRPSTYETHPFYGQRGPRIALRLGAAAGMVKLDQLAQRKDRRLAWGMRVGWVVVQGWVVGHNLKQGKGGR